MKNKQLSPKLRLPVKYAWPLVALFLMGLQTAFSLPQEPQGHHPIQQNQKQEFSFMEQPMSIEDLPCGEYTIAGQLKTWPNGEDILVLYPNTEREFSIPLRGLSAEDSLNLSEVMGVFRVQRPLIDGRPQGRLYLNQFVAAATYTQVYEKPVKRIGSSCQLSQSRRTLPNKPQGQEPGNPRAGR